MVNCHLFLSDFIYLFNYLINQLKEIAQQYLSNNRHTNRQAIQASKFEVFSFTCEPVQAIQCFEKMCELIKATKRLTLLVIHCPRTLWIPHLLLYQNDLSLFAEHTIQTL